VLIEQNCANYFANFTKLAHCHGNTGSHMTISLT